MSGTKREPSAPVPKPTELQRRDEEEAERRAHAARVREEEAHPEENLIAAVQRPPADS